MKMVDCDVILRMNDDVIYLNILNDEFYYSDVNLNDIDVGGCVEYYQIDKIHKNMLLYKNHKIIKYIKKVGEIFKEDLLNSLNENLDDNILEMLKWGLTHIEYKLYENDFKKVVV